MSLPSTSLGLFRPCLDTGEEGAATGLGSVCAASFPLVPEPTDILLVCAGGEGGGFSALIPPWLGAQRGIGSKAVTKGVGVCLDC